MPCTSKVIYLKWFPLHYYRSVIIWHSFHSRCCWGSGYCAMLCLLTVMRFLSDTNRKRTIITAADLYQVSPLQSKSSCFEETH